MTLPLMPKATAVWLVDNTALTFEQISEFCGLHTLEVQAIADGEVSTGIMGRSPVAANILTTEEIARCEADSAAKLKIVETTKQYIDSKKNPKKKTGRYTPIARRQDKPDAIAWLVKKCPNILDTQIVKLIGTTKNTIAAIRDKSHWNYSNITAKDPVLLGLCSQFDLDIIVKDCESRADQEQKLKDKEQEQKADNNL